MKLRTVAITTFLAAGLFAVGTLAPIDIGDGDDEVRGSLTALEAEAEAGTASAEELASLALEYLGRVRSEADPTVIPDARRLAERSLDLQPRDNFAASLAMASISNASHDFSGSVKWSRRAIAIEPFDSAPYGTLGDALFELGKYDAADAAYQKMIDRRPDVGSYVRASYSAQTHGNERVAIHALRLAIQAAGPVGEEAAFLHHQLGDVYAGARDFERSERVNRHGTRIAPGYVPPTVGIAESYIARGRYEDALPIMERAARDLPALEYLITLGDLYWTLGRADDANRTYDLVAERLGVYRDSGVLPDHDFVAFYADHGYRTAAAVEEAQFIYSNRPTPAAADTLAWALHAAGRDRAAMPYIRRALRTMTTPDATGHFHAAAIADGLGLSELAAKWARRALELDPRFSLFHLDEARRLAN